MEKSGKVYKLGAEYPNVKFVTSTVDTQKQKSFNMEVRFWYSKHGETDPELALNNLFRATKKSVFHGIGPYFNQEKFIAIKDIPNDIHSARDKIFALFEFTLYPHAKFSTPVQVSKVFTDITEKIYEDVFEGRNDIKKRKG